jgi:hypothetical protein
LIKAFEALEEYGIIQFKQGVGSKCPKEYRLAHCLLTRGQIQDGVKDSKLPDVLIKWATRN